MIFQDLENEKWVFLKQRHIISSKGRVYSFISSSFLKTTIRKTGYYCISLYEIKGYKTYLFHRLIAIAFIKNTDNKPCVNHINGVRFDNRIENLEWVTHKENTRHAIDTGLRYTRSENDSYTELSCDNCGIVFKRRKYHDSSNKKRNSIHSFCTMNCMFKFNKGKKRKKND